MLMLCLASKQKVNALSLSALFQEILIAGCGVILHVSVKVLTNLVSNAVKFTESGSVVASLELLNNLAEWQWIKLSLKDIGVGIRC